MGLPVRSRLVAVDSVTRGTVELPTVPTRDWLWDHSGRAARRPEARTDLVLSVIRSDTASASQEFADRSVDVVFFDGDHRAKVCGGSGGLDAEGQTGRAAVRAPTSLGFSGVMTLIDEWFPNRLVVADTSIWVAAAPDGTGAVRPASSLPPPRRATVNCRRLSRATATRPAAGARWKGQVAQASARRETRCDARGSQVPLNPEADVLQIDRAVVTGCAAQDGPVRAQSRGPLPGIAVPVRKAPRVGFQPARGPSPVLAIDPRVGIVPGVSRQQIPVVAETEAVSVPARQASAHSSSVGRR